MSDKEEIAKALLRKDRGDVDKSSSSPNCQLLPCARHIAPEHTLGISACVGESLFGGFSEHRGVLGHCVDKNSWLD